jgi:hypothetical protein
MMKNDPLISTIIPVYNGGSNLAEVIESVLAQVYRPIGIYFMDYLITIASGLKSAMHDPSWAMNQRMMHMIWQMPMPALGEDFP